MPNFFYTDANGQKQGPVNDQQLKALAAQGIITPSTPMETDSGHKGTAGQLPGLFAAASALFVQAAPATPSAGTIFCTNCGNSVFENAVACMSCGAAPIGHRKFCRQCGVALNPEQIVCVKCGSAIGNTRVAQSGGGGTGQSLNFGTGSTNPLAGFGTGGITILAAAGLAFLSFFLPWAQLGMLSANGFSKGGFLFGVVFIYPVWAVLAKKIINQIGGYSCAGIGLFCGICFITTHQIEAPFGGSTNVSGAGVLLFMCACIALIVGVVLQCRSSNP